MSQCLVSPIVDECEHPKRGMACRSTCHLRSHYSKSIINFWSLPVYYNQQHTHWELLLDFCPCHTKSYFLTSIFVQIFMVRLIIIATSHAHTPNSKATLNFIRNAEHISVAFHLKRYQYLNSSRFIPICPLLFGHQ